ncbi:MAG: SUMF1/EgtB/PvdO family nonheme iron enzyme, partial [Pseudomonadota bacterium]
GSNNFGLYHVVGNVREWVADGWYETHADAPTDGTARAPIDDRRVVRGGSYADRPSALRSAARAPLIRTTRDAFTGLRVVRDLPPE